LSSLFICHKIHSSSIYSFSAVMDWNVGGLKGTRCGNHLSVLMVYGWIAEVLTLRWVRFCIMFWFTVYHSQ
jgi:hypothetical protein